MPVQCDLARCEFREMAMMTEAVAGATDRAHAARMLVTAASRHGATAEIAQATGQALAERGLTVAVIPPADVRSIGGYDAVIIGSAVYMSHWLDPAKKPAAGSARLLAVITRSPPQRRPDARGTGRADLAAVWSVRLTSCGVTASRTGRGRRAARPASFRRVAEQGASFLTSSPTRIRQCSGRPSTVARARCRPERTHARSCPLPGQAPYGG